MDGKKIEIATIGFKWIRWEENDLNNSTKDYQDFDNWFRKEYNFDEKEYDCLYIDCRKMCNPERDKDLQDHMGYYPQIFKDALQPPLAKDWTRRVVRFIEEESKGRAKLVVLACTSGRHRTRAMENLLHGGLNYAGCDVHQIHSLSEEFWSHKGSKSERCLKCCHQHREDDVDIMDCYSTVYSWLLGDKCKFKPSNQARVAFLTAPQRYKGKSPRNWKLLEADGGTAA